MAIIITNYSKAWVDFKKTEDYKRISDTLKSKGIKQPFRDNIIKCVFASGWNATDQKIVRIK